MRVTKRVTAILVCCFMAITVFAGLGTIFPRQASADEGWLYVSENPSAVDFQYKHLDYNPYYDGNGHLQLQLGLEYPNVIFQHLNARLVNLDTGLTVDELGYENQEKTAITDDAIMAKDEILEKLTGMTNQVDVGKYRLTINCAIYQKEYSNLGVSSAVAKTSRLEFSVLPRPIEVESNSTEKTFDGKALTDSGYTYNRTLDDGTASLLQGDQLEVVISGAQTEVGESENTIDSVKVVNNEGVDVSDKYAITTKAGKLTVNEAAASGGRNGGNNGTGENGGENEGTGGQESDDPTPQTNGGTNNPGSEEATTMVVNRIYKTFVSQVTAADSIGDINQAMLTVPRAGGDSGSAGANGIYADGDGTQSGSWSVLSIILIVVTIAMGVGMFLRRETEENWRMKYSLIAAGIFPLMGVIIFFFLNDINSNMVFIKPSTIIFAGLGILQLINMLTGKGRYEYIDN